MKQKGKKARKLAEKAQEMAEQIAYESAISNTFAFCMEKGMLCLVLLRGERWTQRHVWRILAVGREFVYCLRADDFRYDGYEIHRISDAVDIVPAPELTEQYRMLNVALPAAIPEIDLSDIQGAMSRVAGLDRLVCLTHLGSQESSSSVHIGHLEKLGKKRISIRDLDAHDLSWLPEPAKLAYEDMDSLAFGTPVLCAYEKLAMSYDAYIRSLNESLTVPRDTEDFDVGTDILEGASEDLIDFDEIAESPLDADLSGGKRD